MKIKVLIIDDDEKLNELLHDYLARYDFRVVSVTHPADGLVYIKNTPPDIIILDIMLPGMDGLKVCREIRKEYNIPIIMLTARGEVTDRIVGLEMGADDYIPKPFEPRELVARIQSVCRRCFENVTSNQIRFGALEVDLDKQAVILDSRKIELTTMEFELLSLFMKNPGKVFTRDQLLDRLRGIDWDAFDRSVDLLVSRLRQKLKDTPKNPKYIRTIWGKGYKFIAGEPDD
jgi:DNA-binding response OmpR family regulator